MDRRGLYGALILVAILAGVLSWYWAVQRNEGVPAGLVACDGRLEGNHVLVSSSSAGRLKRLAVATGDCLIKGQVVAEMEDDQILARVQQARYALAQARAGLQILTAAQDVLQGQVAAADAPSRSLGQTSQGALSRLRDKQRELDETLDREHQARISLNQAEIDLADRLITSPVDGLVVGTMAAVGDRLQPGAAVVIIAAQDSMHVTAQVSAAQAAGLQEGQSGQILLDGQPGQAFPARVDSLATSASPSVLERGGNVSTVRLVFIDQPRECLSPGQPARALLSERAEMDAGR